MSHRQSHWIALIAFAALPSATLRADEFPSLANDSWYRVEVVIFERIADAAATQEIFVTQAPRAFPRDVLAFDDDANRDAAYVLDAQSRESNSSEVPVASARTTAAQRPALLTAADRAAAAIADYEAQLQQRSYRFEPQSSLLLSAQAGRLQRSNGYRVVFHRAWIQPVPDRDQLLPLLIQAGDRVGRGWRIEGTLGVTRGRYLHLDARLWYTPDPSPPPVESTMPIAQPGIVDPIVSRLNEGGTASSAEYTQLYEQRRMRSGELHYLDHPKFGVLARVDPVVPPDALVAEIARLGAATAPVQGAPPAAGSSPAPAPGRASPPPQ